MKKVIKMMFKVLLIVILLFLALMGRGVLATEDTANSVTSGLKDSILVTGTQNLVDAIIGWLTGIGITICGGYFIYYVYCLKSNDEGERRRNMQNIKTTLIAMVLITCGLAVIDTILSFYK